MPDRRKVRQLGRYCIALLALVLLGYGLSSTTAQSPWSADDPKVPAASALYSDEQHQVPRQMQAQVPIASQSFMAMMQSGHR